MHGIMLAWRSGLLAGLLLLSSTLWAQEAGTAPAEPSAAPGAVPAQKANPAPLQAAPGLQMEQTAQPAPAPAPAEAKPAEAKPAEAAKPAETKPTEAKPADAKPEENAPGGKSLVILSNRTAFGMSGSVMFMEYGLQGEVASEHFGVNGRWAVFQPYPDDVGFCFDWGFAFHYYPLGGGPSTLYVGPGVLLVHLERNRDPLRAYRAPEELKRTGIVTFNPNGYGKGFDLITPFAEVGYRHLFTLYKTFGISLGVEAQAGFAVSDRVEYWNSGFFWTLNPQVGLGW